MICWWFRGTCYSYLPHLWCFSSLTANITRSHNNNIVLLLHAWTRLNASKCKCAVLHPLPSPYRTHRVDPGSRWSKGRLSYRRALVLDSHLTNLASGVIRLTQSLASSPVTDRMTLNHLHSKKGWLHLERHVTISLVFIWENALRTQRGQSATRMQVCCCCPFVEMYPHCRSLNFVMLGKCMNYCHKCRDETRCGGGGMGGRTLHSFPFGQDEIDCLCLQKTVANDLRGVFSHYLKAMIDM